MQPPEIYDSAMRSVSAQLKEVEEKLDQIEKHLATLNGQVLKHATTLYGDETNELPGLVKTTAELNRFGQQAITVLKLSRWVFGFIGASMLLLFGQSILEAIGAIAGP